MEKRPTEKKKLPLLLIAFMGILVFFTLFFLFEEKPDENISPSTALSTGDDAETKLLPSEPPLGKVRIDSEKTSSSPPAEANKKSLGPTPKKELTFLKTLKEGNKKNPPLTIKKTPGKAQETTKQTVEN